MLLSTQLVSTILGDSVLRELFPVACGLGVGTGLAVVRPGLHLPTGMVLSVGLGFAATAVTGELALTWEYLLVDIPLVAACAVVGLKVTRAWRVRAPADPGVGSGG